VKKEKVGRTVRPWSRPDLYEGKKEGRKAWLVESKTEA
jgi:hypothetical protein